MRSPPHRQPRLFQELLQRSHLLLLARRDHCPTQPLLLLLLLLLPSSVLLLHRRLAEDTNCVLARRLQGARAELLTETTYKKTRPSLLECFRYVCPEPVLVK